jgi:hypothetical protein
VQAQGQQNPILQISIAPAAGKEPMKLTILAPVNVSFPSVARMAVDEKDAQAAELPLPELPISGERSPSRPSPAVIPSAPNTRC